MLAYNFSPHHLFISGFKKDGYIFSCAALHAPRQSLATICRGPPSNCGRPWARQDCRRMEQCSGGTSTAKTLHKMFIISKSFLVQSLFWLPLSRGTLPEFQMSYLEVTGQHSGSVKLPGNIFFHSLAWGDGSPGILLPFLAGTDFTDGSLLAKPFQSPQMGILTNISMHFSTSCWAISLSHTMGSNCHQHNAFTCI